MIKAVLLDLDETLLRNPNQGFVPRYLERVDDFFTRHTGHPVSRVLLQSVRQMSGPRDMEHTNLQLILARLSEATGLDETALRELLEAFYRDAYPALKECTDTVPGAPDLVADLHQMGCRVVIATNPLYPPEAIRQRLIWAGLSGDFNDYALVTHAENMHFAKPDPAYYAEILGRICIEPDEAIMVGDSEVNDIQPAHQIGIHTHLVSPGELNSFMERLPELESLTPLPFTPEAIIPQFRGNLGALFGMIAGIQPQHWHQHPDPNEWSPLQIVCHLLNREPTVHRARLERILRESNPFIADPGLPPGPGEAVPCDADGWHAAQRFLQERQVTIELLRGVDDAAWQRPARHSIFGPTTLLEMAAFTAQHDRLHLHQLCETSGKCVQSDV